MQEKCYTLLCISFFFCNFAADFWWQSHVKELKWSLRDVKGLKTLKHKYNGRKQRNDQE